MARKSKPISVYERIKEKQNEIQEQEDNLKMLNDELQILFNERDKLEMKLLFEQMKAQNLDINKALDLLNNTK